MKLNTKHIEIAFHAGFGDTGDSIPNMLGRFKAQGALFQPTLEEAMLLAFCSALQTYLRLESEHENH